MEILSIIKIKHLLCNAIMYVHTDQPSSANATPL